MKPILCSIWLSVSCSFVASLMIPGITINCFLSFQIMFSKNNVWLKNFDKKLAPRDVVYLHSPNSCWESSRETLRWSEILESLLRDDKMDSILGNPLFSYYLIIHTLNSYQQFKYFIFSRYFPNVLSNPNRMTHRF